MSYKEFLEKVFGWPVDPLDLSEEDDEMFTEMWLKEKGGN